MSASVLPLALALLATAPAGRPKGVETRSQKFAALLSLEDRRTTGGNDLERYLREVDKGVRRRAVLVAGRVGDPSVVPALVDLMNDSDREIRHLTAFSLGLIGDKSACDRLVAALKDTDAVVRARSAEALGRIGDTARAKDVAAMIQAALPKDAPLVTVRGDDAANPDDPWLELRLGLFALARFKDAAVAESILLPGGRTRFDWWAASWTAMRIATPNLRPVFLAAVASSDPASRALGARGLGAIKDAASVDLLAKLAVDREDDVAVEAVRALAAIGDARGVAAASAALNSANVLLKWEALKALSQLPLDRTLRGRIVPYVGHEQPFLRAAAFPALARIDREEFALVLSGLDPDPEWTVRAGLAAALGDVADETSVSLLLGMLKDADPRVLPAVLEALRKARGGDAVETLKRHLSHSDVAVRAAAAQGLVALKVAGLSDALGSAYRQSLTDVDLDARLEVVAALLAQRDELAKRTLREVAERDPVRAVRERAATGLRNLAAPAPALGAEPTTRALLDDHEAMLPFDAPPDRTLYTPRAILYTARGRIEIHLNIIDTPLTTESFMSLARRGFFDGLSFHRVVADFVIQGGCPRGDGAGGPGYSLRSEPSEQPFGRGTVGMANAGKDTEGSQFFIATRPAPHLDGVFTPFGWVASGMAVVDQIRPGDVIDRIEIWDGR